MITGKIGRYEIKSEIAKGGMATVYHAFDPNFGRDVAIKVLPQAFLHDPQFRTRFEREGRMIALLEHPAIVPVYDFGEEQGQPYIVMRYMAGGSLNERLENCSLSLAETAQIVSRLAPALDAAHARHIIHRDLKPGNVLFDQYGNAYLSDFGIARLAETSGQTLTGPSILGTPAYMSPEQIQGEKNIDGRSDLYAMGVLVFQMLTGQTPYHSETPAKVMMMHVLEPVPSILSQSASLPPGCEAFIKKAMAKEPFGRFATAGEFAAALEALASGAPLPFAREEAATLRAAPPSPAILQAAAPTALAAPQVKILTTPQSAERPPRSRLAGVWVPLLAVLCLLAVGAGILGFMGWQGSGPLAFLAPAAAATEASAPTDTPLPATHTPGPIAPTTQSPILSPVVVASDTATPAEILPTATDTPTLVPVAPVIGGADKVAFLNNNEIWVANLDGTELKQLTEDGTLKSNLQWSPDGKSVNYIVGTCVQTVRLEDGRIDIVVCFNYIQYLKAFEISPDGQRVAVSLDNQLYIVPYDTARIAEIKTRSDLAAMAACADLAPYTQNFVKYARWSKDGNTLAMVIFGTAEGIGSADIVKILPVDKCSSYIRPLDHFPPPRFRMDEYVNAPVIQNFGWDGLYLFAFSAYMHNDGFGDLYVYNMDLHKARMKLNPIENKCCYRDPVFSPDGSYLFFAFQAKGGDDSTLFYMIPYGSLGTGATYQPLPLPVLTDPAAKPQVALRPAK